MIKTQHDGFGLQKIELRNDTIPIEEARIWYASYRERHGTRVIDAVGVSPEDAAGRACHNIDLLSAPTEPAPGELATGRFQVPSKLVNEPYEDYLYRMVQAFEEWANKMMQEIRQ